MTLLKTVEPQDAEGAVKEVYDMFLKMGPVIPAPLKMLSVSPDFLKLHSQIIGYFMSHPTLSFTLLAHIRMVVSHRTGYEFCVNFNGGMLTMMADLTDEQIQATLDDPAKASLEDKDKAMLVFVVKAVEEPDSVSQADVDAVREKGWTDRDIYDATAHGANMTAAGILFRAFKMDDC